MPRNSGKFVKQPSPKVELGQLWMDPKGTVRRVVAPLDDFEVHFARVVDGYRTKVARVSKGGAPSGRYTFIPKETPQQDPVHIRRAFGGEHSDTFCGLLAEGLITTTLENLPYWRQRVKNSKRLEFCSVCMKRHTDGTTSALERSQAAEVAA